MMKINELYYDKKTYKYYDYPHEDTEIRDYKVGRPKFKVYHQDNTFTIAYLYGEQHFTYDIEELYKVRIRAANKHAYNKERNTLMEQIKTLDNETLKEIVKKYCVA